ncbi:MAG: 5-oxoprolinase subunit PxpA [Aestuariibacter sp.]
MLLNCDMGEAFGSWSMGQDEQLMPYIDCANIACGFHAGDPSVMRHTLELAKAHNVEVGAHPGYPDLQGFGRRKMHLSAAEMRDCLHYQIAALCGMANIVGVQVSYVKPHGAMYNQMMQDEKLMRVIMSAVSAYPVPLQLMIQATESYATHSNIAQEYNLALRTEAFSDRGYLDNGCLVPRTEPGAVLDKGAAIAQCQALMANGQVRTVSNKLLSLQVDSICIHGDTQDALDIVQGIREAE